MEPPQNPGRINGDFDTYWAFDLAQEHRRIHQARYHHPPTAQPDQQVPATEPTQPTLYAQAAA
jgi:hypothetical protein